LVITYSNLGADFLAGAGSYAFGYATNPFSVIPNLTLFASLLSNNPILVWFIGIGVIAGFVLVAPQSMILMSRILFAYSFDRVAPGFIASVSERWLTPVYGILIAAAGGEVFLVFLSGIVGPTTANTAFLFYSYAALAAIGFTFVPVSIAAIVFPFRRNDLYETSCPIKRKIFGVPVITWLGLIALIYSAASIGYYSYKYNFYFGAGTLAATTYFPFLGSIIGLFIVCIIWFYVARWKRGQEGFPFEKAFKQIPPD
jgi:APA family basic amino acid/polyamine antiporter